jgi:hypothetical protein
LTRWYRTGAIYSLDVVNIDLNDRPRGDRRVMRDAGDEGWLEPATP